MTALFGTLIAIVATIALSILLGPYGVIVIIAMIFGIVLSSYQRMNQIHEDIQLIKEKLGIKDQNEFDMKNEDIEKELEEEYFKENEELDEKK
ncbi:hypothetical protein SAMN04487895_101235 [Paenibacillus sophorae]|uniref:Uncharacterized protein n=1 Tax=Paenibacillus sophorae TaxID=1333845 RepID=A0A1H8FSU1_9BACL|nr:hypothetical protein [Paenibacillus sophorae]QWU13971.1 hypothetical protein KP014_18730 [Paenibacillus sophorae]SEN34803.1 hypothetical protein SAMN04487895_101235 [Paenibacillus sophorae]